MTKTPSALPFHQPHRCPYWLGWLLASPVRRWLEDPDALASALVAPGNQVLEVGPGMGFFTIPLARRVGQDGQIHCVDVQPRMLTGLEERLARQGLRDRVVTRVCSDLDLNIADLSESIDVAVLIHVLHEVPEPRRTLADVAASLRPNGRLLLIEPKGHVKDELFASEVALARQLGLFPCQRPEVLDHYRGFVELLQR